MRHRGDPEIRQLPSPAETNHVRGFDVTMDNGSLINGCVVVQVRESGGEADTDAPDLFRIHRPPPAQRRLEVLFAEIHHERKPAKRSPSI